MIKSYDEMPLGVYNTMLEIMGSARSEEDKDLLLVGLLCGKGEDEMLDLTIPEYLELKKDAGFLFYLPEERKVKKTYTINGREYTLIDDYRKMSAAQYVDFKEWSKAEGENSANLLAVCLVPRGCTYNNGYDVLDVARDVRTGLCVLDAIAIRNFFIRKWETLIRATLRSSERIVRRTRAVDGQTRERVTTLLEDLRRNGGGCPGWTPYPTLPIALGTRLMQGEP